MSTAVVQETSIETGTAPHGFCECRSGCQCAIIAGPVAFEVERDGRKLKVCTRCDLSSDAGKRLLVTKGDPIAPYQNHDPLGALVIALELASQ
jgi:hypothetical protein